MPPLKYTNPPYLTAAEKGITGKGLGIESESTISFFEAMVLDTCDAIWERRADGSDIRFQINCSYSLCI